LDKKTRALAETLRTFVIKPGDSLRRVLVVGCGDGEEGADLAELFGCDVDAIDATDYFCFPHPRVTFTQMDARALSFEDETFDIVWSFHALEHIPEPEQVVLEIRRVLRNDGIFMIGVPNRSRLVGYMTGRGASFRDKLAWNIIDWRMRLTGRFRNEHGAHAGFTIDELDKLLKRIGYASCSTRQYYCHLYPSHRRAIDLLNRTGLWQWVFPCHYFFGRKMRDSPYEMEQGNSEPSDIRRIGADQV